MLQRILLLYLVGMAVNATQQPSFIELYGSHRRTTETNKHTHNHFHFNCIRLDVMLLLLLMLDADDKQFNLSRYTD